MHFDTPVNMLVGVWIIEVGAGSIGVEAAYEYPTGGLGVEVGNGVRVELAASVPGTGEDTAMAGEATRAVSVGAIAQLMMRPTKAMTRTITTIIRTRRERTENRGLAGFGGVGGFVVGAAVAGGEDGSGAPETGRLWLQKRQ